MWGSGYVFTKAGLQYAPPFTFLTLRFGFGLLCLQYVVELMKLIRPELAISEPQNAEAEKDKASLQSQNLGEVR